METILRAIVEADRAARAETDAARKRREDLSLELSECKKQIDARYRQNAEQTIAAARAEMDKKAAHVEKDLDVRTARIREGLQKTYAENKSQWVERIVTAVTNG